MSGNEPQEIQSPCIGVCSMDDSTGFCHGCYRTIDEIKTWWDMDVDAQKELLLVLEERQSQTVSFD